MTSPALVTVIVPGRDVADYAQAAIDSLSAQTEDRWVAYLIDDGSRDATRAIFAAAAHEDVRFRLVALDESRGLSAARNQGISRVDTEYLAFLDADDVMRPGTLERAVRLLETSGSDFVAGAYVRLRADENGRYVPGEIQPWVRAATDPERHLVTLDEHPEATSNIVAWSKISRTRFWHDHGFVFPEGELYEDQVLAQQMYALSSGFDVVPDVFVEWRIRADGSSITQQETSLDVASQAMRAMSASIDALDAHPAAQLARRVQILRMDIPRLLRHGAGQDAGYADAVAAFTARAQTPSALALLTDDERATIAAATRAL